MAANITHGMNVEQVKNLAKKLDEKANQIQQIITETRNILNSVAWEGPDAKRFKSEWESKGVRQLQEAKEILTQTAQAANRNADQQQQASNA